MAAPQILCYHKIDRRFELGVTQLGPRSFARQARALASSWRVIGSGALTDALAKPDGGGTAPVVITFDDGYAALAQYAFPVLAALGIPALVFVITDYVGADNRWDVRYGGRAFRHLSWDQLGWWQERGVEVHSHGATHRRLTWLSDTEAADELGKSREAIRSRLGALPAGICYPFGAADTRLRRLALDAGFTLGFGGPSVPSHPAPDPLMLGRRPVYGWDLFAPPAVMSAGPLGALARWGARSASRFAVVTSMLKSARR